MKVLKLLMLFTAPFMVWAMDPQKIVDDWQACQMFSTLDEECLHIRDQAIIIRDNVEELQQNPQAFGFKIMSIQYQKSQENNSQNASQLDQQLQTMLAIVGWLESPK